MWFQVFLSNTNNFALKELCVVKAPKEVVMRRESDFQRKTVNKK